MLNIPAADIANLGAAAPVAARPQWLECRILTWELRQRVHLAPLAEAVARLPAAHAYVGGDATRLFFALLAGAYGVRGETLAQMPPTPAMEALSKQIGELRASGAAIDAPATELMRLRAAEMQAELTAIAAAVAAEIECQRLLQPMLTRQCPFTGEKIELLNDGRVAVRLD